MIVTQRRSLWEIARCILGTLKYEPHTADTAMLRRALDIIAEVAGR